MLDREVCLDEPVKVPYFSTVVLRRPQFLHSRRRMILPPRMGRV